MGNKQYHKNVVYTDEGVTTTYYLNGSQIIGEETNGNITLYIYDAAGSPIGYQYHGANYAADAWDIYWYEKNLQGDIIAVYNQAGANCASNNRGKLNYYINHFLVDMLPYYMFGNTKNDSKGALKWAVK